MKLVRSMGRRGGPATMAGTQRGTTRHSSSVTVSGTTTPCSLVTLGDSISVVRFEQMEHFWLQRPSG